MYRQINPLAALALVLVTITISVLVSTKSYPEWQMLKRPFAAGARHPIDYYILSANAEARRIQTQLPQTVHDAAAAYRKRRGRHPPPWFDQWVEYATEQGSPIHEEFFDQIHEDLEPFWSVPPQDISHMAQNWHQSISIRDGVASQRNATIFFAYVWMNLWLTAIQEIQTRLPDVDIAFNTVDEPRILVSWEDMAKRMAKSRETKTLRTSTPDGPMLNEYTKFPVPDFDPQPGQFDADFDGKTPYWHKVRATCAPDSLGRHAELDRNWSAPIDFDGLLNEDPTRSLYIHNVTASRDACAHPELRYLHGAYIEPSSHDTMNHTLFPLFSGCKVSGVHNDILIPAAMYFDTWEGYSGGPESKHVVPWEQKTSSVIWLGSATGGNSNKTTWRHYHRHRFMATVNASHVAAAEQLRFDDTLSDAQRQQLRGRTAENVYFPVPGKYRLPAMQSEPTSFGRWTAGFVDNATGFTNLFCSPQALSMFTKGTSCGYMDAFHRHVGFVDMADMFSHKFLPDLDGQSYSGRYRAFLDSTSVPIKSTVYSEWHDARLVPWHHFIPLDVTYKDWWTIMEYFAGYDEAAVLGITAAGDDADDQKQKTKSSSPLHRAPHDDEARAIAYAGLDWSRKAMRRADMVVYTYRLILEYARVCDPRRQQMGYTADL